MPVNTFMEKSDPETTSDCVGSSFADILKMHDRSPACWYHVNHVENSDLNLSSYIGLEKDEYHDVLIALGVLKRTKKNQLWHKTENWKSFLGRYMIEERNFTEQKVGSISSMPRLRWIRLGKVGKHNYQPKNQPGSVKIQSFEKLERKNLDEDGTSLTHRILYIVRGEMQLQKELEEIEAREQVENEGSVAVVDSQESVAIASTAGRTERVFEEVVDGDVINIDSSSYPTLAKANLNLTQNTVNSILREIILLSKNMPDKYVLQHETYHGSTKKVVVVPQVSTDGSFNKLGKTLLKDVQKNLVSDTHCKNRVRIENGSDIESVRAEEEKRMVKRIINHYCVSEKDTFAEVANENGLDLKKEVMSAEYAAAMLSESGVGPTKSRVLNRYLTAFVGKRIMPSENKIFRDETSIDELPPCVRIQELDDKTKVRYYVKPLDRILSLGIKKKLKEEMKEEMKEDEIKRPCKLDLSWSADHGGGFFRAVVKVVLRYDNGTKLKFVHRVGQMQCKKDTYDVISKTMGPDLNSGLCSILEDDRKTPRRIHICKQEDGEYIIVAGRNTIPPNCELLKTIESQDITEAITGDLAFYALMLGKPGMDSKWCFLCDLAAREWACVHKVNGNMWNNNTLNAKRYAIIADSKMKAHDRKGVKYIPILDVDPSLFIPPPLHIKLGLVNRAFIKPTGVSYMSWSQSRVENIPISERIAHNLLIEADENICDRKEDQILWNLQHVDDYAAAKERLSEVQTDLGVRNLPIDQKQSLEFDKAVIKSEIEGYVISKKEMEAALKKARSDRKSFKAAYESEKKKRTYSSKLIHNKKEEALRSIGVDRGAAHGGDLQGRGCTNLLQRADEFFDQCLEIDLDACENGSTLASREEIIIVNKKFRELAILMERLMHFIMLDHDEVKAYGDNLHDDLERHIEIYVWMWNHLRISMAAAKFHLVKDHLVDCLKKWGSLGQYNEEFIEADHVRGNSEIRTYAALLRTPQRREDAISKNAARTSNPLVRSIVNEISPQKNQKRRRLTKDDQERIKLRRMEVFNSVLYLKNNILGAAAGDDTEVAQIADYWNLATDKV